jgi:DNA-binding NarL/FixJ family response regulator
MIGTRSVLVIEPDDDDRGGFAGTLRSKGVIVDSASAPGSIAFNRYAMVIVDPLTPGLNPAALIETLRQTAPRPMTLVMIDHLDPVRGFGADVIHGYIRRDTEGDQLAELIRDCLAALRECGTGSQPVRRPDAGIPNYH